jgi:hypothetical protein
MLYTLLSKSGFQIFGENKIYTYNEQDVLDRAEELDLDIGTDTYDYRFVNFEDNMLPILDFTSSIVMQDHGGDSDSDAVHTAVYDALYPLSITTMQAKTYMFPRSMEKDSEVMELQIKNGTPEIEKEIVGQLGEMSGGECSPIYDILEEFNELYTLMVKLRDDVFCRASSVMTEDDLTSTVSTNKITIYLPSGKILGVRMIKKEEDFETDFFF